MKSFFATIFTLFVLALTASAGHSSGPNFAVLACPCGLDSSTNKCYTYCQTKRDLNKFQYRNLVHASEEEVRAPEEVRSLANAAEEEVRAPEEV